MFMSRRSRSWCRATSKSSALGGFPGRYSRMSRSLTGDRQVKADGVLTPAMPQCVKFIRQHFNRNALVVSLPGAFHSHLFVIPPET